WNDDREDRLLLPHQISHEASQMGWWRRGTALSYSRGLELSVIQSHCCWQTTRQMKWSSHDSWFADTRLLNHLAHELQHAIENVSIVAKRKVRVAVQQTGGA